MPCVNLTNSVSRRQKAVEYGDLLVLWIKRLNYYRFLRSQPSRPMKRGTRRGENTAAAERLEEIAAFTGLEIPETATSAVVAEKIMLSKLRGQITRGERRMQAEGWRSALPPALRRNLESMENLLGLGEAEAKCLTFAVFIAVNEEMATSASLGGSVNRQTATEAVAAAVGISSAEARDAFSGESRLMSSKLLGFSRTDCPLDDRFNWYIRGFAQEMMSPGFNPLHALRSRIVRAPQPVISWSDFDHLGELRDLILAYLKQCRQTNRQGVNILIHGEPGVGKSEFTRLLAREIGCDLFEVSTEDDDGDPIDPLGRLQALRVLHGFSAGQQCLLVFDEVEDVFPKPGLFSLQRPRPKGWLNRILENNPSSTLWLSNSVEGIDPAIVRRFDVVLELKTPPTADREALLRNLPLNLPSHTIRKLADCQQLTPAVVQRAARVLQSVSPEFSVDKSPAIFETIVNQTLRAQGLAQINSLHAGQAIYDPRFVNSDLDLPDLATGVAQAGSARICLFGPPGTGKTAFGRWLAGRLGRPLHLKKASDLLSPYVGQAEKNIARAFSEASAAKALLMIDEVDSFLRDRSAAHRGWEVTQVNEFLTQMEQFEGVFIASTNLMDGLDPAAMRRFELKAKFDYLRGEQAKELLCAHLSAQGLPAPNEPELDEVAAMPCLTPGDFAALARQNRFRPLPDVRAWLDGLAAECSFKPNASRRITGFGSLS